MSPKGRIEGLDTLRGIAALCVAVFHTSAIYECFQPFPGGYLAVDFFFVLSGFVMARRYEGTTIAAGTFIRSRVARMWPTMALGVALGALAHRADPMLLPMIVAGLLMLPLLSVNDQAFPVNNPGWSIFFELLANFVHITVLRHLSNRSICWLLAVLGVLGVAIVSRYGGLKPGPYAQAFGWGVPRALLSYCLGLYLSRRWTDRAAPAVPFVATMALLPVMLTRPLQTIDPAGWSDLLFVAFACPLLIAGGLRHATRWGTWLGAISFPLYAIHYPVLQLARQSGLPPVAGLGAALVLAAAIDQVARRARFDVSFRRRAATA